MHYVYTFCLERIITANPTRQNVCRTSHCAQLHLGSNWHVAEEVTGMKWSVASIVIYTEEVLTEIINGDILTHSHNFP
jgi:hypothetical protein